jgi:IS5 family transposase
MIDWEWFEAELACNFSETDGAPAKPTRLMVGLHYLKHTFNLSDERTVAQWVENPYWQLFCGMKHFEHEAPIDPSLMTRWRKMVGDGKMEALLKESIEAGFRSKTITAKSLENVNLDTTVQEKAVAFPTDARLYFRMLEMLVKRAKKSGLELRQSYVRVAKRAWVNSGRYFHARQHGRGRREVRRLKTYLGRLTRDIARKMEADSSFKDAFAKLLALAERLLAQKKDSKNKIYSLHAPEVECIAKGKVHVKYEFGNKAAFVTTSREGFALGSMGLHGNPYDGHTAKGSIEQAKRLCSVGEKPGRKFKRAYGDRGFKGHGYTGDVEIHICGPGTGKNFPRSLRRWRRRRAAIEPMIGHRKNDGRLGRNYLLGEDGDRVNVILCAAGHNMRLILAKLAKIFTAFLARFTVLARFLAGIAGRGTVRNALTAAQRQPWLALSA